VVAFPHLLDRLEPARGAAAAPGAPSEPALAVMFPITASVTALAAVIALTLPRSSALTGARGARRLAQVVRASALRAAAGRGVPRLPDAPGPDGDVRDLRARARRQPRTPVSHLWLLMLALELPLLTFLGASLQRVGARGLLAIGLVAGGVRWLICGFAPESSWMGPAQVLHGVVVAGLVIGQPALRRGGRARAAARDRAEPARDDRRERGRASCRTWRRGC
jgi:hypothetical protein